MESTLTFKGANSIYDFLVFEEVIGASQPYTGEQYLLIRGIGVVPIDRNFAFKGHLRTEICNIFF